MRPLLSLTALITTAAVVACRPDRPTAALPGPQFAHVQDLDGTPDLIVDAQRLKDSWVVYDQTFSATLCSVVEGDVQPGDHRVLRFTVTTPNIGDADVFVGNPLDHVAANDGLLSSPPATTTSIFAITPRTSYSMRRPATPGGRQSAVSACSTSRRGRLTAA